MYFFHTFPQPNQRTVRTMLLQEPAESQYDIRFRLMGFPTRISWSFWLAAVVLGYDLCQGIDRSFAPASPGAFGLLFIWAGCMGLSIFIHELGHAIAFRRYGIESSIVLYYMGGLAIPGPSSRGGRAFRSVGSREELIIAAAGPAFQIGSAAILVLITWGMGYRVSLMPWPFSNLEILSNGLNEFDGVMPFSLVNFYVWPSVAWALLNLVPVLPLDGGRIAKSIIEMNGGSFATALWVSVISATLLALYGFKSDQMFIGIFFASLAINNYQAINPGNSW